MKELFKNDEKVAETFRTAGAIAALLLIVLFSG